MGEKSDWDTKIPWFFSAGSPVIWKSEWWITLLHSCIWCGPHLVGETNKSGMGNQMTSVKEMKLDFPVVSHLKKVMTAEPPKGAAPLWLWINVNPGGSYYSVYCKYILYDFTWICQFVMIVSADIMIWTPSQHHILSLIIYFVYLFLSTKTKSPSKISTQGSGQVWIGNSSDMAHYVHRRFGPLSVAWGPMGSVLGQGMVYFPHGIVSFPIKKPWWFPILMLHASLPRGYEYVKPMSKLW